MNSDSSATLFINLECMNKRVKRPMSVGVQNTFKKIFSYPIRSILIRLYSQLSMLIHGFLNNISNK